jgi:hypothetical protein
MRDGVIRQTGQRYDAQRPRKAGHQEAIDAVSHRSGEELSEWPWVVFVGLLKQSQVSLSLFLVNDCGRISVADQQKREDEPANPAISVWERVGALECSVQPGEMLYQVAVRWLIAGRFLEPIAYKRWDDAWRRRPEASPQRLDIAGAIAPGVSSSRRLDKIGFADLSGSSAINCT